MARIGQPGLRLVSAGDNFGVVTKSNVSGFEQTIRRILNKVCAVPFDAPGSRLGLIQLPPRVSNPSPAQHSQFAAAIRFAGTQLSGDGSSGDGSAAEEVTDEPIVERLNYAARDGKSIPPSGRAESAAGDACASIEIPRPRAATARLFSQQPVPLSRGGWRPWS